MSDRLLIRLHPDGALSWLAQDAAGRAQSSTNNGAPPPATLARARQVVVLVPAEQVVLLETDAVTTRRAQLARAVPFALEDQLASPVEDLHFALPERVDRARIVAAVVARARLQGWIDALTAQGIHADALVAESAALSPAEGTAVVLVEDDRALLRWGTVQAIACASAALPQWLSVLAPPPLDVHDFRRSARVDLPVDVAHYHERQSDPLAWLAAQMPTTPGPNLLQGEFAPRHRHLPLQQLWQRAALVAAAVVLLAFLFAGLDWLRLERASARLEAEQRDVLQSALPQFAAVPGDPRQLMESALNRMRGDPGHGGLLALLDRIGPVLANTTRVSLRGLEYRNATLELGLRAPDVPALDLVREQLQNLGLTVEVTSATSGDKGVDGRLRISGGKT